MTHHEQDTVSAAPAEQNLPVGRNLKIGFFHLGSGMADVLATGIWNRIMISDLGFAATPIGLLASLRYFLAPMGIWAGRVSDSRAILGYRRLFWIWLGRALMIASVFLLGTQTANIARGAAVDAWTWILIGGALFLFSFGTAISGSTFLALVYDRSNQRQRGRAVGIVWTFLLLGFTIGGVLFGVMLPTVESREIFTWMGSAAATFEQYRVFMFEGHPGYTPDTIEALFMSAGLIMGVLWFFSLVGEERRSSGAVNAASGQPNPEDTNVWQDLKLVWQSRSLRFFAAYLGLSMAFAFSQDLILEPFAAEVFNMSARHTTRFAAYWGSTAIAGTVLFLWLSRRVSWLSNTNLSYIGIVVLIIAFAIFGVSAMFEIRALVTIGLVVLGVGLGVWNVGTLGLMMDMSPVERAGTFLGFWTLLVTFTRGFGVAGGGVFRDIFVGMTGGNVALSYGLVFFVGVAGLALSFYMLMRVNVKAFVPQTQRHETAQILAGALD